MSVSPPFMPVSLPPVMMRDRDRWMADRDSRVGVSRVRVSCFGIS